MSIWVMFSNSIWSTTRPTSVSSATMPSLGIWWTGRMVVLVAANVCYLCCVKGHERTEQSRKRNEGVCRGKTHVGQTS